MVFPEPEGPRITERKGIFGTTSYLDCLVSNSFRAMGFMDGMRFLFSHLFIIMLENIIEFIAHTTPTFLSVVVARLVEKQCENCKAEREEEIVQEQAPTDEVE
jgi:hypothetical protein